MVTKIIPLSNSMYSKEESGPMEVSGTENVSALTINGPGGGAAPEISSYAKVSGSMVGIWTRKVPSADC